MKTNVNDVKELEQCGGFFPQANYLARRMRHPLSICAALIAFLTAAVTSSSGQQSSSSTRELAVSVQAAGKPIAGATVILYAAGTGAPAKLAEGETDDQGGFKLDASHAPADSVLYVVAKGGTPMAGGSRARMTLSGSWPCSTRHPPTLSP
jgi:hypothetical protein